MVFTSVGFAFAFLPVVLIGYGLLRRTGARNGWLLAASLLFYVVGSGAIALVLVATTLLDWVLSLRIASARAAGDARTVKGLVAFSVAVNLGALGWFKYANFAVDDVIGPIAGMLGAVGPTLAPIALPVGISFFTFQRLSYVLDVARGDEEPLRKPQDLLLYIALFPQLIAGPIVRFSEIREQLHVRTHSVDRFASGAIRFAHGFAKKVIVADTVAVIADAGFGASDELGFVGAWIAVLAYTVQIYFDFSGYSDMAIGLGQMFGFDFPENFRRPYSAISVTDFWRRWHITLSTWFRDYVYIPLGGSRGATGSTLRNLAIVFLLTGLWHGAAWTFVAWGAWHGVLLVIERQTDQRPVDADGVGLIVVRRAVTFLLVVLGWVLFRAESLGQAWTIWQLMAQPTSWGVPAELAATLDRRAVALLAFGLGSAFLPGGVVMGPALSRPMLAPRRPSRLRLPARPRLAAGHAAVLGLFAYSLLLIVSGTFSPFLYFRF